jgi:voltage-gated potassium channel
VTTVGYGDVVPASIAGRATAALVMLAGLSFLAVTTAAVTNAFVQAAARRRRAHPDDAVLAEIRQLRAELDELRAELLAATKKNAPDTGSSDAPG